MEDTKGQTTPATLDLLSFPLEVLRMIGSHLDRQSLASLSSVSREHRRILRSDVFESVSFFHSETPFLAKLQYFLDDSDPSLKHLRSHVEHATILAYYVPVTIETSKWSSKLDPQMDWLFDDSIPGPGDLLPQQMLKTIQSMNNLQVLTIDCPDALYAAGLSYKYLEVFDNAPPLTISTLIIKGQMFNNHGGAVLRACSPDHLKALEMTCEIHPYRRPWLIIPDPYYTAVKYHGPTLQRLYIDWHSRSPSLDDRFLRVVETTPLVSQDFPELQRLVLCQHGDFQQYSGWYGEDDEDREPVVDSSESDIKTLGNSLAQMERLTHFGFTSHHGRRWRDEHYEPTAEFPESLILKLGRLAPKIQHFSVSESYSACCEGIRTEEGDWRLVRYEPTHLDWGRDQTAPSPQLLRIFNADNPLLSLRDTS